MRIAYIILAHRLPEQLARLIRRLSDGQSAFFVHLDRSADRRNGYDLARAVRGALPGDVEVLFLKRYACRWGSFRIVEATLEGMRAIVRSGRSFERVVLLSGQDYPIKPTTQIRSCFERHADREFMESFLLTAPNRWSAHGGAYNALARVGRWHLHFRSRSWMLPWRRSFPPGVQPYGGSQWWALTMPCVAHICEVAQREHGLVGFFRNSFIPDELFFHTIVSNSPFAARLSGHDLTFADWSRPQPPYPATIDGSYLQALAVSPKLFARKFDADKDAAVLDLIDERLLRGPAPTAAASRCGSPRDVRHRAAHSRPAPARTAGR